MTRIYVPRDSAALALGADGLADAIAREAAQRGIAIELIRNGSRGLLWLEPLVEVATPRGRVGYANVDTADVASLFDAGFIDADFDASAHPNHVGIVDEIPYLQKQQRLTFARIGITDPLSTDDYLAHGGLEGLKQALAADGDAACEALIESGLRGRGGAAFPAGIKWRTVRGAKAAAEVHRLQRRRRRLRHVLRPPDHGERSVRADRRDDHRRHRHGGDLGYIYVRSEYPHADRDTRNRHRTRP
jgi:formate dehydrogenase iron-sulfur subunit